MEARIGWDVERFRRGCDTTPHCPIPPCTIPPCAHPAMKVVFIGTLFGMTGFGVMGDLLGRNRSMVFTLTVMGTGALLSGVAPHGSDAAVWGILLGSRFLIGVGAGGVYPLSAAKVRQAGMGRDGMGRGGMLCRDE